MARFGAVETGGSKVICAVGSWPDDAGDRARIPTTTPRETLVRVTEFLLRRHRQEPLAGIGVGSFGPLDLDPTSPTRGQVTATPKPGWRGADVLGAIQEALGVPVDIDTDVNAAALGEWRWGAGRRLDCVVYMTVGTGIGGGAVVHGRPLHGASHPEMGHVRIPHDRAFDAFEGVCPHHGDCLEGLASGPAMEARWGTPPASLPDGHPAWRVEAEHLANGLANIVLTLSPQRIIVGGGVTRRASLFPKIRARLAELLQGYGVTPAIASDMGAYVVPPALGEDAGIAGAFTLAEAASRIANDLER